MLRVPELSEHTSPCAALRFAAALEGLAMRSCLTVPIATAREGLRGALVFGSSAPDAFTERSERIVSSIAAQSIVGLERAGFSMRCRRRAMRRINSSRCSATSCARRSIR